MGGRGREMGSGREEKRKIRMVMNRSGDEEGGGRIKEEEE